MNILQFIFRDFWTFIGTAILLDIVGTMISDIIGNILKVYMANKMIKEGKSIQDVQMLLCDKEDK